MTPRRVRIVTVPGPFIRAEVRALEPWTDPNTRERTDYIVGFTTAENARKWVERQGWEVAG